MNEATRAWIYRVLLAVQPLVVAYGLVTETIAVLWLSVASAVLGTGLASYNTSTKAPDDDAGRADLYGIATLAVITLTAVILAVVAWRLIDHRPTGL